MKQRSDGGVGSGGGGEVGVVEELGAGEAGGGGVFGLGEGDEALDAHVDVLLGEELGVVGEELGAEGSVGCVLLGEEELLEIGIVGIELGEGGIELWSGEEVVVEFFEGGGEAGDGRGDVGGGEVGRWKPGAGRGGGRAGVHSVRGFFGFEQAGHDSPPSFCPTNASWVHSVPLVYILGKRSGLVQE